MKRGKFQIGLVLYFCLLTLSQFGIAIFLTAWIAELLLEVPETPIEISSFTWLVIYSVILGCALYITFCKRIFASIKRLSKAMNQVAGGNFKLRLQTRSMIREMQDMYANFNRMAQELDATEVLQSDFISNVSHEFKTPLTAIEGYAILLQNGAASGGEQSAYVERILLNTRRLSDLVGNVLLLSKVDHQAILKNQTLLQLDEQIRQAIVAQEPKWAEKEIEFDVEMEEITYFGNEGLMYQIWSNLINNAIKFDPQGGSVTIRMYQQDNCIRFTIADNGPGIDAQAQKHIFDRFYQSDTSHKEEGVGLGLALVKRILDLCGGTVSVETRPEGGSRFTVLLPVTEPRETG